MPKATWNGAVLAESDAAKVQIVEGNVYFPPAAADRTYLRESRTTSICGWKGTASYYDVVVGEAANKNAAWVYRDPKPEARHIAGHIGFWKGVSIEK